MLRQINRSHKNRAIKKNDEHIWLVLHYIYIKYNFNCLPHCENIYIYIWFALNGSFFPSSISFQLNLLSCFYSRYLNVRCVAIFRWKIIVFIRFYKIELDHLMRRYTNFLNIITFVFFFLFKFTCCVKHLSYLCLFAYL